MCTSRSLFTPDPPFHVNSSYLWGYVSCKKDLERLLKAAQVHRGNHNISTLSPSKAPTVSHNRARHEPGRSGQIRHRVWSAGQLFPINPGDPGLLAASPQHVSLCLHTLISFVSVQECPEDGDLCINVPLSPILYPPPSLSHKSQRSSWNRWGKLEDQRRPTPEQTGRANGPAAFSSPQIISGARECSQSSRDVNAKAG